MPRVRHNDGLGLGERRIAFAILGASMQGEEITRPLINEYYQLAGPNPVSKLTFQTALEFFTEEGFIEVTSSTKQSVNRQGDTKLYNATYAATPEGLARLGLIYLAGITDQFRTDVEGFRREANTPLGQFATDWAMGSYDGRASGSPEQ
jgi:hypothetical protein